MSVDPTGLGEDISLYLKTALPVYDSASLTSDTHGGQGWTMRQRAKMSRHNLFIPPCADVHVIPPLRIQRRDIIVRSGLVSKPANRAYRFRI